MPDHGTRKCSLGEFLVCAVYPIDLFISLEKQTNQMDSIDAVDSIDVIGGEGDAYEREESIGWDH